MNDNKKKLNEQLVKVVLDDGLTDEIRLKKVKYLVRLGANVNQKVNGKSLLKIAREKGYKEIENVIEESLRKSFEKALDSGNYEIVIKEIKDVKRGKPIVSKDEILGLGKQFWDVDGNMKSAKEIEDLIQQGAYVDIVNNDGNTVLMIASKNGYKDVVEVLLEGGADVHQKNKYGNTALTWAAEKGHKEIVEMLLEGGADVNHKDNNGWTALTWAAKKGHKEIVEMLLEGGADVNQKDNRGSTALMEVTKKGYKEIVQLLLENGADVNAQENDGWAALMWASARGRLDVVNILLEGGADVNVQNKYGSTALMMASGPLKNAIIKEIEEHIQETKPIVSKEEVLSLGKQFKKTKPTIGGFWGKIFDGLTR